MMKVLNPCAQNDMESTSSGSIASKTPSASKKLFVIKTMQEGVAKLKVLDSLRIENLVGESDFPIFW